jgi:hypothetical protein
MLIWCMCCTAGAPAAFGQPSGFGAAAPSSPFGGGGSGSSGFAAFASQPAGFGGAAAGGFGGGGGFGALGGGMQTPQAKPQSGSSNLWQMRK